MTKPLLIAGAIFAALASPAHAQSTGDSATVDAIANLVLADQPLALTGIAPLNFGQVTIPRQGNAVCSYILRGDGNRGLTEGNVGYGEGPSPAGCSYRDNRTTRASMALRCEADRVVILQIRSESSGVQGRDVFFETFDDFVEVDGQERYTWDQRCTGAEMILRIGGQLAVRGEARPTETEVQVGAITIEAFYP